MNNHENWMSGWDRGGMWVWSVIGVLVVMLLIVMINKMLKK